MIAGDSAAIPAARTAVSADAALILEALGRLESAVQNERAMLDRLRVSLREMAHSIAMTKALADSETAATLLDEFEHRVDAMIEIAGGAPPEAPAIEPEPPAALAEAEPAPVATAHAEPPAAEPPPAAEHDQVPTVSGVVSRLGPDPDPFNEAVVKALHATEGADEHASSVAMLKAMVEALNAAVPAAAPEPETASETPQQAAAAEDTVASAIEVAAIPAEAEPATMQAEEQPPPIEVAHVAEPPVTTEIELSAAPLPSVDIITAIPEPEAESETLPVALADDTVPLDWHVAAETAESLVETGPAMAAAEIAPTETTPTEVLQLEEAQFAEPPIATDIGLSAAPLPSVDIVAAALPPAASEPEPVAPAADTASLDWHIATEPAEPEPVAAMAAAEIAPAEVLQLEEAQIAEPQQAVAADLPAEPVSVPSTAGLHETALLASIERMGTRPFPPPDEGTAVIFTLRPEHSAPRQTAALPPEPAPLAVPLPEPAITQTALESMLAAPPATFGIGAETGPTDAELEAAMADPDFDPTDFLFGPETEPEAAAFLLDPPPPEPHQAEEPQADPPAKSRPDDPPEPESSHDPLRALKAMSENEKIALFS